jgi:hypothetical protein
VIHGTRYEWAIDEEVRRERNRRIEARRFLPTPAPPTGWPPLQPEDNLVERMEAIWPKSRISDVKREEIAADARGEDLWLARGGRDE